MPVDSSTVLVVAWHVVVLALLYSVSALSKSVKVFLPHRYLLGTAPATALLLAIACRALEPARGRRVLATALLAIAVGTGMTTRHELEIYNRDWRSVVAVLNDIERPAPLPILACSGIVDMYVDRFDEPDFLSMTLSPFERYPLERKGLPVTPVPSYPTPAMLPYLDGVLARTATAREFILVGPARSTLFTHAHERIAKLGYERTADIEVGGCWVEVFAKKP